MESQADHSDIEHYGDPLIASKDAPVPRWLIFNYIFWPLWGIVWFYFFWNGSYGWLDRGYWRELQEAARTTFPFVTTHAAEAAKEHGKQD
jgi:hypothetical protein